MPDVNVEISALKEKAMLLLKEGESMVQSMNEISEWNSLGEVLKNIEQLFDFTMKLVLAVEIVVKKSNETIKEIKSGEKLDMAVQMLDDLIKLPWYLEAMDGPLLKIAISFAVSTINRIHGNDWDLDKAEEAIAKGKDFLQMIPLAG